MHQDQRIGLALGVLLVGACAAFFFRNEARELPNVPQLENARALDERIAERPMRPYAKGIEAVEMADRRRTAAVANQAQTLASTNSSPMFSWNLFSLFGSKVKDVKIAFENKRPEKTPSPESDVHEFDPITLPSESKVVQHESSDEAADSPGATSSANDDSANGRTYVVQKGETLSSIAAKLLGDRSRYPELFEANQDQLDDPNDVKLGMTLRIPQSRKQAAPSIANRSRAANRENAPVTQPLQTQSAPRFQSLPPVADINSSNSRPLGLEPTSIPAPPKRSVGSQADSAVERPKTTADSSAAKKFIPVRRSPLPRQASPQAHAGDERTLSGRKLSQISQESSSSKIAR
jgi:hypothetical protein